MAITAASGCSALLIRITRTIHLRFIFDQNGPPSCSEKSVIRANQLYLPGTTNHLTDEHTRLPLRCASDYKNLFSAFAFYAEYHNNAVNQLIHIMSVWMCCVTHLRPHHTRINKTAQVPNRDVAL